MSADNVSRIAGLEPTYSAREAAAVLRRSYSWLDQRLRRGELVAPDGSAFKPCRAANGYRYFSSQTLREIAASCYRRRWYSFDELKAVLSELATDVQYGPVSAGSSFISGRDASPRPSSHTAAD